MVSLQLFDVNYRKPSLSFICSISRGKLLGKLREIFEISKFFKELKDFLCRRFSGFLSFLGFFNFCIEFCLFFLLFQDFQEIFWQFKEVIKLLSCFTSFIGFLRFWRLKIVQDF